MDNFSTGEAGGIIAGGLAMLATIGGAIRWLLGFQDRRKERWDQKLLRWEQTLQQRERAIQEHMEKRLTVAEEKVSVLGMALFELIGEVQIIEPANPVLVRVKVMLGKAYPTDMDTPAELRALIKRVGGEE